MPVQLTYPGVYVEEIPSAVHPIMGVSTSITAFVGTTPRGPVGKPIECLNFGDYVKNFGGLDPDSDMGYAINQFFTNGGTNAQVLRVAGSATSSSLDLKAPSLDVVLHVTSLFYGNAANFISVTIKTRETADGLFNLSVAYKDPGNPGNDIVEDFFGLSMDQTDASYVVSVINDEDTGSQLVRVRDMLATDANLQNKITNKATLTSAGLTYVDGSNAKQVVDVGQLLNKDNSDLTIVINQSMVVEVDSVQPAAGFADNVKPPDRLAAVCNQIQLAVRAAAAKAAPANPPELTGFTCVPDIANGIIQLTAGKSGYLSEIVVGGSAASVLMLGASNGGSSIPSVAQLNPLATDAPQVLVGGTETALDPKGNASVYFAGFIGDPTKRTGLYALEQIDLFNILCLPGITSQSNPPAPAILAMAAAYCEQRRAFLVIDSPEPSDGIPFNPTSMKQAISTGPLFPKSDHAAVYYPWVKVPDPLQGGRSRLVPPCGTVAGIYARTDANRGVWKAPAGIETAILGIAGVDYRMNDGENGDLNPLGVNCLRNFPVYGPVVWGARTLRGADQFASDYKYVPVRRFALFLEESLYRGLKWAVFEPNDEPLWAAIRLNVGAFMHDLFVKGAFEGSSPRDAYQVRCDSSTTLQNDIDKGIVNIIVAFAPLKPAEFVVLQIQQMAGQIQT